MSGSAMAFPWQMLPFYQLNLIPPACNHNVSKHSVSRGVGLYKWVSFYDIFVAREVSFELLSKLYYSYLDLKRKIISGKCGRQITLPRCVFSVERQIYGFIDALLTANICRKESEKWTISIWDHVKAWEENFSSIVSYSSTWQWSRLSISDQTVR